MGSIKECAEELRIHLMFIPPGNTDELQPIDRAVFGIMKAVCRFCSGNRALMIP
jgi:hypothetical protein